MITLSGAIGCYKSLKCHFAPKNSTCLNILCAVREMWWKEPSVLRDNEALLLLQSVENRQTKLLVWTMSLYLRSIVLK